MVRTHPVGISFWEALPPLPLAVVAPLVVMLPPAASFPPAFIVPPAAPLPLVAPLVLVKSPGPVDDAAASDCDPVVAAGPEPHPPAPDLDVSGSEASSLPPTSPSTMHAGSRAIHTAKARALRDLFFEASPDTVNLGHERVAAC